MANFCESIFTTFNRKKVPCAHFFPTVLGYPPYQETTGFNTASKNMPSEEDRLAITELFNKKQALMVELQHYEANAASGSTSIETLERPATAMPTNTRLQVAVVHSADEVTIG